MSDFQGYRRADGRVGVRNHVLVLPLSVAASPIAQTIADHAGPRVKAAPHEMTVEHASPNTDQTERTLIGVGKNPNVAAVVVLALGTEYSDEATIADEIAQSGKPVETCTVREIGGTAASIERGNEIVEALSRETVEQKREAADASELIFGVECGGSDATSGIASNPAVGHACDRLIEDGGTACFSETPEFIGAEHILADRCVDDSVRERLLERVAYREHLADLMGVDMRGAQPSPGNQEGGLTTIEEKSLGAIAKGGTTPIQAMVDYAESLPTGGGLTIMDTPGYDVESVVGKVAGGAQVIAFTTGRGSTTGNPIAPVIKVCGNPQTWGRMANNMDINASRLFAGDSIADIGDRIYEKLLAVADGQPTESERRGLEEFAINAIHPLEGKVAEVNQ